MRNIDIELIEQKLEPKMAFDSNPHYINHLNNNQNIFLCYYELSPVL